MKYISWGILKSHCVMSSCNDDKGKLSSPSIMEVRTSTIDSNLMKKEIRASSPVPISSTPPKGEDQSPQSPATPLNNFAVTQDLILQQLCQQQQFQQELLLQQYRQQQQQLAEAHEQQLQLHLEYLEQKTRMAEEERSQRQKLEDERIEAIKKKDRNEHSAIASNEVKQILQDKILKKLRDNNNDSSLIGVNASSTIRSRLGGVHSAMSNSEDFPLRKTASEPNICLKLRLRQRVIEHRSSPIFKRKDRILGPVRRRNICSYNAESGSNPDSGRSSPPNEFHVSQSSSGSTPIHEETTGPCSYGPVSHGTDDLNHPFSSLPNISLGRPPHSNQNESSKLPIVSEAEIATAARVGVPMSGYLLSSNAFPSYRHLSSNDSCGVGSSPLLHQSPSYLTTLNNSNKAVGSVLSSSLLAGNPLARQYSKDSQHVRQAVLKRSSGKNYVENVEEETESAVADAMATEKPSQVLLDLREKRSRAAEGSSSWLNTSSDRLSVHQQQPAQYLLNCSTSQPSSGLPYGPRSGSHMARPLSRALSSPLVTVSSPGSPSYKVEPVFINKQGATTGLIYDSLMEKHQCLCGTIESHPEHAGRIQAIWSRLQDTGLAPLCYRLIGRKATLEEIQSCHSEAHTLFFGTNPMNRMHLDFHKLGEMPIKNFVKLPCGGIGVDSDTTWHEIHTSSAARMAVGCALELAFKVASGELLNGFAVVRPPGHHAEYQLAMGFCFFNTVAIVAKQLLQKFSLQKVLIVDWDVHHGNGIQAAFYENSHVLYISLHRFDDGSFFPGTGSPSEVGEGDGIGFNVNVAFQGALNPPMGDAEYLSAFRTIVLPIAKEFAPDIVLVSAGFDSAMKHPPTLGGYEVSSGCFAHMTSSLMTLAKGKIALILEGGYEVESVCDASEACIRALLGESPPSVPEAELSRPPALCAVEALQITITCQSEHWPVLRRSSSTVAMSHLEATRAQEQQEEEEFGSAPVNAMALLNVNHGSQPMAVAETFITPPVVTLDTEEPMDDDQGIE